MEEISKNQDIQNRIIPDMKKGLHEQKHTLESLQKKQADLTKMQTNLNNQRTILLRMIACLKVNLTKQRGEIENPEGG